MKGEPMPNNVQFNTNTLPPVGDFFLWLKLDTGEIIQATRRSYVQSKTSPWPVRDVRGFCYEANVVAWAYI